MKRLSSKSSALLNNPRGFSFPKKVVQGMVLGKVRINMLSFLTPLLPNIVQSWICSRWQSPAVKNKKKAGTLPSDWSLQIVKEGYPVPLIMIRALAVLAVVGTMGGLKVGFLKPKLLSWNVRGLNEGDKWLRVRNLLRQLKVDIICLQETKLEHISSSVV